MSHHWEALPQSYLKQKLKLSTDDSLWTLNSTDVGLGHGHQNLPAPMSFCLSAKRILSLSVMEVMFLRVYLKKR